MSASETGNNLGMKSLKRANRRIKEHLVRLSTGTGKFETAIPGLSITRFDEETKSENCFYQPAIGVVVQGFKHTTIGNQAYQYGENYCLVNGVDMPSLNTIVGASRKQPFLAFSLLIDRELSIRLNGEISAGVSHAPNAVDGVSVAVVEPDVLEAFSRLFDLLDQPDQLRVLAPMIVREIHYRTMIGPQGGCLRLICTQGSQTSQVAAAISWLRENYASPIHIDDLARLVNMATSTFHRHFKHVTSLSPLQFQKRLRLYEAQRLMLNEDRDATSACLAVGYESPTQFNREYKRLFGEPPHRDISRMRRQ